MDFPPQGFTARQWDKSRQRDVKTVRAGHASVNNIQGIFRGNRFGARVQ
jgi:hypothetical protein